MSKSDRFARDMVKTLAEEPMKQHIVYDTNHRMVTVYEARADAENGDKAMRTDYQYENTSARISDMKESYDVWDSSWDF